MHIPDEVRQAVADPTVWANRRVSALSHIQDDGSITETGVDLPISRLLPHTTVLATICKVSKSAKRLETTCDIAEAEATSFPYVDVIPVLGNGAILGVLFVWRIPVLMASPDFLLLSNQTSTTAVHTVNEAFTYKDLRLTEFLTDTDYSVYLTTKLRWFRPRYSPKTLGFAKEER